MKITRNTHLYYIPDGNETGNTDVVEEVAVDESPTNQAVEEETQGFTEFDDDMELDEMEAKMEAESTLGNTEEAPEEPNAEEVEEVDEPEAVEDTPEEVIEEPTDAANPDILMINEEYVTEHPEDAEILKQIKGETFSPQALKNYLNAQRLIETLKQQAEPKDKPLEQQLRTTETPESKPLATYDDNELKSYENNAIVNKIKAKYPDFPDDGMTNREALNAYFGDMAYDRAADYEDFREDFRQAKLEVHENIQKEVEIGKNWKNYAANTMDEGFKEFGEFLKSKGVKPEDLGVTLDSDLAKSVIYQKDGNMNPFVMFRHKGIPIVMKERFVAALKEQFMDNIISYKEKTAGAKAYEQRKEAEPPPSISGANLGNHAAPQSNSKVVTDDMGLEEAEEIMKNSL